jgi:hypothetical protein
MHALAIRMLRFGLLAACSCSSDSSAAQNWAGSWDRGGTQTVACGGAPTTAQLDGTVSITLGSASGTFETSATCDLTWDVSGSGDDSATLEPGGGCTVLVNGADVSVTFSKGSATLNESTITSTASGSASNDCTVTQSTTLTRVAVPPQGSR